MVSSSLGKTFAAESPNAFVNAAGGLRWQWQLLVFLVAALAIMSRRPDAFLNPQFYAEDGAVWYGDAYNYGWLHSLPFPAGGYINLLPRLVAGAALLIPLRFGPLLMNSFGLFVAVLPVTILLSSRCLGWGSLPVRFGQAAIYVALPNSREINVVLTNAQWHLALLACLLAFAAPPPNWRWRIFDIVVLTISGLTGPFGIVLLPLVCFFWWKRRQSFSLVVIGIFSAAALIQISKLLSNPRDIAHLGATPVLFARILSGEVFFSALLGENMLVFHEAALIAVLVSALGVGFLIYCALKANLELRLFICFSALLLAASLKSPLISGPLPLWQLLELISGDRYWFFPSLAFLWSLLWVATQQQPKLLRNLSLLALLLLCRGIPHDWKYPPFKDEHFAAYVQQFNAAAPGTTVAIPLNPGWVIMRLVKKR